MDLTGLYEYKREVSKFYEELVENVFLEELRKAENRNLTVKEFRNEIRAVEKTHNSKTYNGVRKKFEKYLEEQPLFESASESVSKIVNQTKEKPINKEHAVSDAYDAATYSFGNLGGTLVLPENLNKPKLVFSPGNLSPIEVLDQAEETIESFINGFIQTLEGNTYQEKMQKIRDLRFGYISQSSKYILSRSEERLRDAAFNQKITKQKDSDF